MKDAIYEELETIVYQQAGVNISTHDLRDVAEDPYGAALDWMVEYAEERE